MVSYKELGLVNTRKMLELALERRFAVPGYNINNLEQLQAIIIGCGESESPVIIQISQGARAYANQTMLRYLGQGGVEMAKELGYEIPIALHLDHGNSFDLCKAVIDSGFSSVMFDGSHLPYEENIKITKRVVEYARERDVSVEAELGILAGIEETDDRRKFAKLEVSYKPQYISPEYEGTVHELLASIAKENFDSSWYKTEIIRPLKVDLILDRNITELSGGELQKVAIAMCLSRDVELYLFDEPSAYLDVEERLHMSKTIRRVIEKRNVTAFVVEHDVVAQDFIADQLMVFTGTPGKIGIANPPTTLRNGMNIFLKEMQVTFRRDPSSKRPRVNKEKSKLDKSQKQIGEYYYANTSNE